MTAQLDIQMPVMQTREIIRTIHQGAVSLITDYKKLDRMVEDSGKRKPPLSEHRQTSCSYDRCRRQHT